MPTLSESRSLRSQTLLVYSKYIIDKETILVHNENVIIYTNYQELFSNINYWLGTVECLMLVKKKTNKKNIGIT